MMWPTTKHYFMGVVMGGAVALGGCSTTAAGASAAAAMAEVLSSNSTAKASRLRAEMQSEVQSFEEAQLPRYEESPTAYLGMIAQMQKKGLWFASLAHIDAWESQSKASDHSRLLRADALRHTGNLALSASLYRQLLDGKLADRAWHGLGLLAAAQGQFDVAVSHLQAAQKKSPTDALLLNDLGYALMHTARGAEAGLPLKQAAQLQPQNVRIQSNLALYLAVFGQPEDAVAWMQQTAMGPEQRMRVLERAQVLGAKEVAARIPVQVLSLPETSRPQSGCTGCLIFEKQLTVTPSASAS